jgi:DNA-binding MarR family transcriptional regulator
MAGTRSPEAELELAAAYRGALRRFLRRTEAIAADAELTPERYDLLLAIKAAAVTGNAATVGMLAERLDLRQQAVTEIVKRAEESGLVDRRRSEADGRIFYLRLTPDGNARLMKAFRALRRDRLALVEAFHDLDIRFKAATPPDGRRRGRSSG